MLREPATTARGQAVRTHWSVGWRMFWTRKKPQEPHAVYQELPTYAADETERMLEAMHGDGFVLIRHVLTPAEVESARQKIDALTPVYWDFTGPTDHYKNVFNRDPFWLPFLDR